MNTYKISFGQKKKRQSLSYLITSDSVFTFSRVIPDLIFYYIFFTKMWNHAKQIKVNLVHLKSLYYERVYVFLLDDAAVVVYQPTDWSGG